MRNQDTPRSQRPHILLLGRTNAGKSTIFNLLTGQQSSIVSPTRGTTTDAVSRAMELQPFGPVVLVDTAGLGDEGNLGEERMRRTQALLRRADAALWIEDGAAPSPEEYRRFTGQELPHLVVVTKSNLLTESSRAELERLYPHAFFLDAASGEAQVAPLRTALAELLSSLTAAPTPLVGDLVPVGGTVLLVTPIDEGAPQGRLILPQVQVLRDCLDHGLHTMVVRDSELPGALKRLSQIDLVITDSQVFAQVDKMLPSTLPLTSFSMLLARQSGGFAQFLEGAKALECLPSSAEILMLEGCTHNATHGDIGRMKIPALLREKTGKELHFTMCSGYDFPDDLSSYALAIQCGGCMLARRELENRRKLLAEACIPVTNYGMVLAWGAGILQRCAAVYPA